MSVPKSLLTGPEYFSTYSSLTAGEADESITVASTHTELQTAITNAGSQGKVLVNATVTLGADITAVNCTIYSTNGASIVCGANSIKLQHNAKLLGLNISGTGNVVVEIDSQGSFDDGEIACCDISGAALYAIYFPASTDNLYHTRWLIARNRITTANSGETYGVYSHRGRFVRIVENEITDFTQSGVQFIGSSFHEVRRNIIDGGGTAKHCVWLLSTGEAVLGNTQEQKRTVVESNWLKGSTEEALGTDVVGNDIDGSALNYQYQITGTTGTHAGDNMVIQVADASNRNMTNETVSVLTGASAGAIAEVRPGTMTSSGGTLSIQIKDDTITSAQFTNLAVDDWITVGFASKEHKFRSNLIEPATNNTANRSHGIQIWGVGWGIEIEGNIINMPEGQDGGIEFVNLGGLFGAAEDYISGMVANCTCRFNTVNGGKIRVFGLSYTTEANTKNSSTSYDILCADNKAETNNQPWERNNDATNTFGSDLSDEVGWSNNGSAENPSSGTWVSGSVGSDNLQVPFNPDRGAEQDRTRAGRRFSAGSGTL